MDRSYASGAAGSAPAAPASPSIGYPTAGNPGTGVPATKPGPYWYHQVTEELLAIITAAGITPAQGTLTQLASAIQSGKLFSSAAGGTADALTGAYTPAIAAPANGMTLYVRASSANVTATPTFTPNSGIIAAKQIVKGAGAALAAGDIAGGGHWIELQYDLTLDKWVLLNPAQVGRLIGTQVFTASGTYTPSVGTNLVVVEVIGGGGGGGSSAGTGAGQIAGGAGGGAGGYAKKKVSTPGVQTITVGSGGAGGTLGGAGVTGNTSSFGAFCSATGGAGGNGGTAGATGSGVGVIGGIGSGGDLNVRGGSSSGPWGIGANPIVRSGAGGNGIYGVGGDIVVTYATGNAASGYGGGGGGGACPPSTGSAATGGAGSNGIVIVLEYA